MKTITKERKARIDRYLKGIYNLTPAPTEPYFSHMPCECCGSPLGGDRYEFYGRVGKKLANKVVMLSCCVDCFGHLFS